MVEKEFVIKDSDHLFDISICWRGGSAAQAKRHERRGEKPCRNCQDAANRAKEDRQARRGGSCSS